MFHSHFARRLCTATTVAALMIGVIRPESRAAAPDESLPAPPTLLRRGPGFALPEGPVIPQQITNRASAQCYGVALTSTWQVQPWWRVLGSYTFLRSFADAATRSVDPHNQFYLQSAWDLIDDLVFDSILRYVDNLSGAQVALYLALSLRVDWRPVDGLSVFVVGGNLLDNNHPEFFTDQFAGMAAAQVQQEIYGGVALRY